MAQTPPSRRALVDLPVNTLGTPSTLTSLRKASMGQKRQIQEVEEPECEQPRSRVRVSPVRYQSTPMDNTPPAQVSSPFSFKKFSLTFCIRHSQLCQESCPFIHLSHLYKPKVPRKNKQKRWGMATLKTATRILPCLRSSTSIPTIQWYPSKLQPQR